MHNPEKYFTEFLKLQISKALKGSKMETKKKFNRRAFISAGLLVSGIGLPFSGYMNHILGFDPLTTAHHFWMAAHWTAGVLFTIFAVIHITLNRHSVKNYLGSFIKAFMSKEVLAAISIVVFLTALIASHVFHVR